MPCRKELQAVSQFQLPWEMNGAYLTGAIVGSTIALHWMSEPEAREPASRGGNAGRGRRAPGKPGRARAYSETAVRGHDWTRIHTFNSSSAPSGAECRKAEVETKAERDAHIDREEPFVLQRIVELDHPRRR